MCMDNWWAKILLSTQSNAIPLTAVLMIPFTFKKRDDQIGRMSPDC